MLFSGRSILFDEIRSSMEVQVMQCLSARNVKSTSRVQIPVDTVRLPCTDDVLCLGEEVQYFLQLWVKQRGSLVFWYLPETPVGLGCDTI